MAEHASTVVMTPPASLRRTLYLVLETARDGDRLSRTVDLFLMAVITLSIVAVVLESIPSIEAKFQGFFYWLEVCTVCIFSVEYFLRVWTAVENDMSGERRFYWLATRIRYMLTTHAIIDLLAILPFYLFLFGIFGNVDMRFLRAIRLLRVLKLTRYSSAFDMLATCCKDNVSALGASFFVLLTVMLLAASGMYFFERGAQPVAFGSIPAAMWWSFATLTTVGYGDVTPITVGGKVFGALITVVGIGMVALPTGILASGYAQQLRLRSDEYDARAEAALDDGELSASEITDLEQLRKSLGISKHAASQILDSRMVRQALRQQHPSDVCPHCGGGLDKQS